MITIEVLMKDDQDLYSLSIDGHSILGGIYFSDFDWIAEMKEGIEKHFPHMTDLKAQAIAEHAHRDILAAYLKHQYQNFKKYRQGDPLCKSAFDHNYNPSHYFNYEAAA